MPLAVLSDVESREVLLAQVRSEAARQAAIRRQGMRPHVPEPLEFPWELTANLSARSGVRP